MTSYGRVARLTALALATGTLVAAGAGTAGATTTTKDVFNAGGAGQVLSLTVNLPVALPAPIGSQITQDLVTTGTNVRTSGLAGTGAAAVTNALLGSNGTVPVVSQVLDKSLSASWGSSNPSASTGQLPANPLLTGGVFELIGNTSNPDANSSTPVAYAKSDVVNLKLDPGAANLQAVLDALSAALKTNLTSVIGTSPSGNPVAPVAGVTTTLTDALGKVADALPSTLPAGASQTVKDQVANLSNLLNQLPQELSTNLANLTSTDTSLLKIGLVTSEQTVTHESGVVTSHTHNALADISLLGGLVKLGALSSDATAALGNGAQQATANGFSDVLNVDALNGLLTGEVTNQLQAILGSNEAALQPAIDAVNGALAQVTSTLKSALGANLITGKSTTSKNANAASASESAAELVVQPVGFAKPIVDLQLVPATASVSKVTAQSVITPTQVTPAQAAQSAPVIMAHTGAEFGLTAPIAVGLLGLAFAARRRRMLAE